MTTQAMGQALTFGQARILGGSAAVHVSQTLSPDASALSVLFDDLRLDLQGSAPRRGSLEVVLEVPLVRHRKALRPSLVAHLRGSLFRVGRAATGVDCRVGGARRSIGLGPSGPGTRVLEAEVRCRLRELPSEGEERILVRIAVSGHRASGADSALGVVDSLDLVFATRG